MAAATGGLLAGAAAAHAVWVDAGAATSGALTVASVPTTTVTCGSATLVGRNFTWTAVAGATGYRLRHGPGGATVTDVSAATLSFEAADTTAGSTFWVLVRRAYPAVEWVSPASNVRTYTGGLAGSCT